MPPWNATKAKAQLRISVQRLRTLQRKKEAQAKASRRDIAMLLERLKIETARVKVENIINEDIHIELLELLELYCELLIARFGLLDQNTREPDPGVYEGVCAIIHAAPRTELKELHVLRDILMHKYGREFSVAVMDNKDQCVSDRVTRKLNVDTPSQQLVDAYLAEIAKAYGVKCALATVDLGDNGVNEGLKTDQASHSPSANDSKTAVSGDSEKTPKLPEIPPTEDEAVGSKKPRQPKSSSAEDVVSKPTTLRSDDDFDALAQRLSNLKKR